MPPFRQGVHVLTDVDSPLCPDHLDPGLSELPPAPLVKQQPGQTMPLQSWHLPLERPLVATCGAEGSDQHATLWLPHEPHGLQWRQPRHVRLPTWGFPAHTRRIYSAS